MGREKKRLLSDFVRFRVGKKPPENVTLPTSPKEDEVVTRLEASDVNTVSQLNQFRTLANDRQTQYNSYDEMKSDPIISAALELYADDATQYDEQGRIIWVESDDDVIARAANRLLDIFEIPERAWKHIYQACLYGDYYLKLYRQDIEDDDDDSSIKNYGTTRIVNDKLSDNKGRQSTPPYEEYVEDVEDPATVFDLRKRGKTAGFIVAEHDENIQGRTSTIIGNQFTFQSKDVRVYRPDRFIHIMVGENLSRYPETVEIALGDGSQVTYTSARGKSVLQDVYPIQKELQLLEDSLLLNRLTRSSLIRLLEIELGDMPKKEVNDYLRRIKNLVEQHISMDKDTGTYKSYNSPGPIDNVIYIPVRNGKGSISVNNLGGDVNVREIADIDYFMSKRNGALKIPGAYLGEDMEGSGLSNGGSLTRLSIRYARTIKRIQTAYIRAVTTLLNFFFVDKKLDYVNKFTVRMTSPSTQEDLERAEMINSNIDTVSAIMDLTSSLEGSTQKKVLSHLVSNIMKMPEISQMIDEDTTPEEEVSIEGGGTGGGPDIDVGVDLGPEDFGDEGGSVDTSGAFGDESGDAEGGFSDADFAEFEDEI